MFTEFTIYLVSNTNNIMKKLILVTPLLIISTYLLAQKSATTDHSPQQKTETPTKKSTKAPESWTVTKSNQESKPDNAKGDVTNRDNPCKGCITKGVEKNEKNEKNTDAQKKTTTSRTRPKEIPN